MKYGQDQIIETSNFLPLRSEATKKYLEPAANLKSLIGFFNH